MAIIDRELQEEQEMRQHYPTYTHEQKVSSGQSKFGSFVEAWANIIVGFTINWCANMLILPMFGFDITAAKAFWIGVVFTGISLARSYILRRWFNGLKFNWNKEKIDAATP